MVQQILTFLAQNPLFLGLGILVAVAVWLLMAAMLSILLPGSREPEGLSESDWEQIPMPPSARYTAHSYDGPQALSPGPSSSPIWFKPTEAATPVFSQLRGLPMAPSNLAPVLQQEKPDSSAQWIMKERLDSLAGKLENLETAGAPKTSFPADISRFDEKVSRLSESLRELDHSIKSAPDFAEQKSQLEQKLDLMAKKFLARLDQMASAEPSLDEAVRPIQETVRVEIESAIAEARREREKRMKEIQEAEAEAMRRAEETRRAEAAALQEVQDVLRLNEGTVGSKRQAMEKAWDGLIQENKAFQLKKAAEPPQVSLDNLRAAQNQLQSRLLALNEHKERERQRQEKILMRLQRRLERWQTAWRNRMAADQTRLDAEWQVLEDHRLASLEKFGAERTQLETRLTALKQEEEKLQQAREQFQKDVVEAWEKEKVTHALEADHLQEQSNAIEAGIQDAQAQIASEKEQFENMIRENRQALRTKQAEWKEKLKAVQDDFEQKAVVAKEEIKRQAQNFENEKLIISKKEAEDREALERKFAESKAEQSRALELIDGEKEEWNVKLGQWRSRVQELEKMRDDLRDTYAQERADQVERAGKQTLWTEQRLSSLQKVLDQVRQNLVDQLGIFAREKNVITTNIKSLREEFQQRAAAAVSNLENKRKALDTERREAEAQHAAFLASSWDDEQKLKQEIETLEKESSVLEKKLNVFRGKRERVIERLQERHERILLKLHQEVDQQKVQGEARIAEERIALETLKARLANRQVRIAKIRQKQDEQLQVLFDELNATLELVRQGHRSESQVWINRMKSIQNQRDLGLKRRESLTGTDAVSKKMQEKETQEIQRFEQEEARLRDEREQYWKNVVDFSASNQDALRKIMEEIKGSGDDLDRREALAMDILSRVREQLTQIRTFQKHLKPFNPENPISGLQK